MMDEVQKEKLIKMVLEIPIEKWYSLHNGSQMYGTLVKGIKIEIGCHYKSSFILVDYYSIELKGDRRKIYCKIRDYCDNVLESSIKKEKEKREQKLLRILGIEY